MNTPSSRNGGFSLIELLVVMLIIGIIAAFAVPAASNIARGSAMTQASQILVDQLSLARQAALARNHQIEVRFIRFVDPETPNDTGADNQPGNFRAIWVFDVQDNGVAVPLDKPQMLPQAIVMSPSSSLSPLLASQSNYTLTSPKPPSLTDPQTYPRTSAKYPNGISYTYIPFRFMMDGSTNLTPQTTLWFVTLQNVNDTTQGITPPTNFFTVSVDAFGGTLRTFRPGI